MTYGQFLKQEGTQEGFTAGLITGVEKGGKTGREEGKQEKAVEVAKALLLNLHLDIDIVQRTPGEAWLSKRVKFPSGQGIANQPELSVAA